MGAVASKGCCWAVKPPRYCLRRRSRFWSSGSRSSQHQNAAGLIHRTPGIDVTGKSPAERVADGDDAVDALGRTLLVRLHVTSRIMTNRNVGGIPPQYRMTAMPERA